VSFGNVGIVGTAAAAAGVTDAIGVTHILGSMEDAAKVSRCGAAPGRAPR
jgi:hypothetical protein